jgi:superfamily II DNA or RNA helicase
VKPKKNKDAGTLSVRTVDALVVLQAWIAGFDAGTRKRGEEYYANGQVLAAWAAADHYVEAEVRGGELYGVTLFLTRGRWTGQCECPVGTECKHVAAAGLAWIASQGADFDEASPIGGAVAPASLVSPAPSPASASALARAGATYSPPPVVPKPPAKKIPFREQWTPVLAEKLGRPLTESEGRHLAQLAALFNDFTQAHHTLYEDTLRRHGFAYAIPPNSYQWTPLYRGWWTHDAAPADPWALWQFIAYDLTQRGRPIPPVFAPLTDTAPVHASLDALLAQQQLHTWRMALTQPANLGYVEPSAGPLAAGTNLRARLAADGGLFLEMRAALDKPWKAPLHKWLTQLLRARASDFDALPPAEAALALALALACRTIYPPSGKQALPPETAGEILANRAAHGAIVLPDGRPFTFEAEPLVPEAVVAESASDRFEVRLVAPDGTPATDARLIATRPEPMYLHAGRVWRGPPPLPNAPLPTAALADPEIMGRLRAARVRLPKAVEARRRLVVLRPRLKLWLHEPENNYGYHTTQFHAKLTAHAAEPSCAQEWRGTGGWQWTKGAAPPARRPDDPILEFDLTAANAVGARFADFRLGWADWHGTWVRPAPKNLPEEFLAWHATLPPGVEIDAAPELAALFAAPLKATMDFSAIPAGAGHDWFDLTVALRVEDTTLTPDEIALLLKARGKWVRLPSGGWRRLELSGAEPDSAAAKTLDRLGLTAEDVFATGKSAKHRLHALQLAGEAAAIESRDAKLAAALRERVAALAARPPPALPPGLTATLRPYQVEGFHFLAHLAAQGFGGVLADDMGLGKTVQTLAWLLQLRDAAAADPARAETPFRALVVCPKSVTHGWLAETARFAPSLAVVAFHPLELGPASDTARAPLLVANYAQLRLHAEWFQSGAWDAVVLDEGQFIKNPTSQAAVAARALAARHRVVLTGTPVENRLTDLWSLFAFAQPGLLGPQATFRRQYDDKDPAALSRLHRRVRHFLLRRTKAQAAPDLPPRTEDEIIVELEPAQRKLYDAELKRARAQLLGIETARALDKVRFNVLASLLRLRQICCHPALIDPAHAELPSAKLDALLERVEELHEEGHQVLVFSQFVEMLEIIRARLVAADIGHLMLTGQTENRAELVNTFQSDKTKTVFLLSLKAAGFGLNLTAASYAILYDPWWNPAVEAQAIDRTHRIGQTRPVIAYRLLAENTIEQKIRALQQEKAALAAAVVQEESLAKVLDLDSLRKILE